MKFLWLILFISCSSLTIKDFTGCADEGSSGAFCAHYLTDQTTQLDKQEWDALRFGWIAISPQDFANLKVELEQACSMIKCTYEQQQSIKQFFEKMQRR